MRFMILAALLIGCADEDKGTTDGDETETQDETGNDETTDEEGSSTDDDTNDSPQHRLPFPNFAASRRCYPFLGLAFFCLYFELSL